MRGPVVESIETIALRELCPPLVSSTLAGPVARVTSESFSKAIREPVAFDQTVAALEAREPRTYLGPAGTLATFMEYLLGPGARSKILSTVRAFGRSAERIQAIVAARER